MGINVQDDFDKLKGAVDDFVRASEDWRGQLISDDGQSTQANSTKPSTQANSTKQSASANPAKPSAQPDATDQPAQANPTNQPLRRITPKEKAALRDLKSAEDSLETSVSVSVPTDIATLRVVFDKVQIHLNKVILRLYATFSNISQTDSAKAKEGTAKTALGDLDSAVQGIETDLAPNLPQSSTKNLFLEFMKGVIEHTATIERNQKVEITQASYDATEDLFEGNRLSQGAPGLHELLDCWTAVIVLFTQQVPGPDQLVSSPDKIGFEAEFFVIHNRLEELYERVGNAR